MTNIIVGILLLASLFFFFVGTLGLLRMPNVLTRLHATTKCDTLGAGLAFFALMIHYEMSVITLKLFIIIAFIWITNPTAGHAIGRAIYKRQGLSDKFER